MLIDFLRSLVRIRLVGSFFSAILLDFLLAYELSLLYVFLFPFILDVHRGVVGNIQAFHVCAPGSIPGDGVFLKRIHKSLAHIEEIKKVIGKRGGAVVARQAHNLQVG